MLLPTIKGRGICNEHSKPYKLYLMSLKNKIILNTLIYLPIVNLDHLWTTPFLSSNL